MNNDHVLKLKYMYLAMHLKDSDKTFYFIAILFILEHNMSILENIKNIIFRQEFRKILCSKYLGLIFVFVWHLILLCEFLLVLVSYIARY